MTPHQHRTLNDYIERVLHEEYPVDSADWEDNMNLNTPIEQTPVNEVPTKSSDSTSRP